MTDMASAATVLRTDLAEALRGQGDNGQRAVDLLRAAHKLLTDPGLLPASAEVAQSCCRGALDSIFKIVGESPGIQTAQRSVVKCAKALVAAYGEREDLAGALSDLADAVAELEAEEAFPGGARIRQVGSLVLRQTGREAGAAERIAARESWTKFYQDTSGVLHGSASSPERAEAVFIGLIAAIDQLFLGLPERAARLRAIAMLERPTAADAREVKLMTDPRAGDYFLRAAVSADWLELLPAERLLPDGSRWPAMPYLQRLLTRDPQLVCAWVRGQMSALKALGPSAVALAARLLIDAGMTASPIMREVLRAAEGDRRVSEAVAWWACRVPVEDRNRQWIAVLEGVLADAQFTGWETWESTRLLLALAEAADPERVQQDQGKRAAGARHALAGLVRQYVEGDRLASWKARTIDLAHTAVDDDRYSTFLAPLMRALLDHASAEARHGTPLEVRTGAMTASTGDDIQIKLMTAHLSQSAAFDCATSGPAMATWWDTAVDLAGRVVQSQVVHPESWDFIELVVQQCAPERLPALEQALAEGVGPAPTTTEIDRWCTEQAAERAPLPARWHVVWKLAPLLPAAVLTSWTLLLQILNNISGPAARPAAPTVTIAVGEPHGGLPVAALAVQAQQDGPAAAVASLVGAAVAERHGETERDLHAGVLSELVSASPQLWASDPEGVATSARSTSVRAAYFSALDEAFRREELDAATHLEAVATAAFAVRPDEGRDDSAADRLRRVVCRLLQRSWNADIPPGHVTAPAVTWLIAQVTRWAHLPVNAPGRDPLEVALNTTGGAALNALLTWGGKQAGNAHGHLPTPVTQVVDTLLHQRPAHGPALSMIGANLTWLHALAPGWTYTHADSLFALDQPWRPARTWLRHGQYHSSIMSRFNQEDLKTTLTLPVSDHPRAQPDTKAINREQAQAAVEYVTSALIDTAAPLGDAAQFLTSLAARTPRGPDAVSQILSSLGHTVASESLDPAVVDFAVALWRSVLNAHVPADALRGTGSFARCRFMDDQTWLELTAMTAAQQPNLVYRRAIAQRAAEHPQSAAAQAVVTGLLTVSSEPHWEDLEVVRYARQILDAARSGPGPGWTPLQRALIDAGHVEAAFSDSQQEGDTPAG
ncbi:hypothetical protein [Actinacidiphila rubida]|uniref:hypothetical protein n=1 Tax=Actinacidiphila rubida TaxID=310780 RepID=UPI00114C96E5|nr:hypothetical protein [Actinacidiphila rubida]